MSYKVAMVLADGGYILLEEMFDNPADAANAGEYALSNDVVEDAVDYEVYDDEE